MQLKQLARVHLAKAGFNPDEPRIPKGDHGGGEWTDGEGAAASASTSSNSDPRAGLPVLESTSPAPAPDLRALFGSNDVGANAVWNIVPVADFSGGFHDAVVDAWVDYFQKNGIPFVQTPEFALSVLITR